jgi:hypothetical protein
VGRASSDTCDAGRQPVAVRRIEPGRRLGLRRVIRFRKSQRPDYIGYSFEPKARMSRSRHQMQKRFLRKFVVRQLAGNESFPDRNNPPA